MRTIPRPEDNSQHSMASYRLSNPKIARSTALVNNGWGLPETDGMSSHLDEFITSFHRPLMAPAYNKSNRILEAAAIQQQVDAAICNFMFLKAKIGMTFAQAALYANFTHECLRNRRLARRHSIMSAHPCAAYD